MRLTTAPDDQFIIHDAAHEPRATWKAGGRCPIFLENRSGINEALGRPGNFAYEKMGGARQAKYSFIFSLE